MGDIHVIDDNSESTDLLAFYSGDENVSSYHWSANTILAFFFLLSFETKDDVISLSSTTNTDTTSRSRSETPTNKLNGKRGKKPKKPKTVRASFKFRYFPYFHFILYWAWGQRNLRSFWLHLDRTLRRTMANRYSVHNLIISWNLANHKFSHRWEAIEFQFMNAPTLATSICSNAMRIQMWVLP